MKRHHYLFKLTAFWAFLLQPFLHAGLPIPDPQRITPYYPNLDLDRTVFSKPGSWLVIAPEEGDISPTPRLMLRTLRARAEPPKWYGRWTQNIFQIVLFHEGEELPYHASSLPWQIRLSTAEGEVSIAFQDDETVLISSPGIELVLVAAQQYSWQTDQRYGVKTLSVNAGRMMHFIKVSPQASLINEPEWTVSDGSTLSAMRISAGGTPFSAAIRINEYETLWEEPLPPMDALVLKRRSEIETWMEKMPSVPPHLQDAAKTAWYQLFAFQVEPAGKITRRIVLSSKNRWLTRIWAWDHCFHALALASADPKMAWDNILVLFDNQFPNGCLPDSVSEQLADTGYVKPPIHGWAIRELTRIVGWEASRPYLESIYEPLARFTDYWYTYRDPDLDGMPHYRHGNDSGWDNCTLFDDNEPIEGVDLASYLIIQMELLADIAHTMDKPEVSRQWHRRAKAQLDKLLQRQQNHRLRSVTEKGKTVPANSSLIDYMALMLGGKLPKETINAMVSDLKETKGFLTPFGFASEHPQSPHYELNGYWRGPSWAPPNYQLFRAMIDLGDIPFAREIADRYTRTLAHEPGFWEHYDTVKGGALQAPGVMWTAACFMLMAHWLETHPAQENISVLSLNHEQTQLVQV